MAGFLILYCTENVVAQFGIAGSGPESPIEVMFDLRKEAGANLAIGGEPDSAAGSAKGLTHGSDNADLTHAVGKGVATRCFTGVAWCEINQGEDAADAIDNLLERDHDFGRPQAAFFKGHELDEPDHHVLFARKPGEALNLIIVEPAQQDAVDLEGREAGGACGANAPEHRFKASGNARDAL